MQERTVQGTEQAALFCLPDGEGGFDFHAARDNGFGVLIAAAGKAAHLAGALAAQTTLPVIGIPVKSSTFDGLDALLSTVQMPSGMPVATVAIDGAANAALLAAQILAVEDEALAGKPWRKSCWRCARHSMTRSSPRTRRWLLNNTKHEHSKSASINCCGRQP
mgnify:CR=1 FL=1